MTDADTDGWDPDAEGNLPDETQYEGPAGVGSETPDEPEWPQTGWAVDEPHEPDDPGPAEPVSGPRLYAEICVNTPLGRTVGSSLGADRNADPEGRTFTYAVPDRLAGRVQPGHLVWVPFRARRLQGVVLRLGAVTPSFATHDIEALVWAQPVLTQLQLDLAYWVSSYYLAPLIEALRLMLPAHLSQRGQTVLARTRQPAPPDLTPTQAALLAQIAEGEGVWAEVSAGLGKVTQRDHLEPLVERGLVSREVAFATPPPRPKVNRRVRLLADEAVIERILPSLGKTSLEADILTWLAAQDEPSPDIAGLCRALGCTPERVYALAKGGRFTALPSRDWIRRCVSDAGLPQALALLGGAKKKANPKQAAALTALPTGLVDEVEFRAAHHLAAATLRAWAEDGLVERVEEPGPVSLAIARAAVPAAVIELRGGAKFRQVLAALQRHEGPPWIGWVYAETDATLDVLHSLEASGLITIEEEMVWRDPLAGQEFRPDHPPALTSDQEQVWAEIGEWMGSGAAAEPLRGSGGATQEGQSHGDASQRSAGAVDLSGRDVSQAAGSRERFRPGAEEAESGGTLAEELARRRSAGGGARVYLLHGVTGSGKTEIYLRAIETALGQGRQAAVLVPEIALTPQTVQRFAARFPGRVTVWHSDLSDGERFDMWRRVRTGHPAAQVVVGSRSALFLPFPDLGLIVVDEEHESSYKQIHTPRYHARTAAIELGRLAGIPVILGSATPALESYYAARMNAIRLLTLARRVMGSGGAPSSESSQGNASQSSGPTGMLRKGADTSPTAWRSAGAQPPGDASQRSLFERTGEVREAAAMAELPRVEVVDMRQELRVGNRSMFSRALSAALQVVLAHGQQAILFLNRRGSASFVMCRDCGHVESCPRCDVPLTFHGVGNVLVCHHCNRRYPVPTICPKCSSRRIRYFGSGTQNVEEAVHQAFPAARTLRWDRDVTGAKGAHEAILSQFAGRKADVLIGTQMIAKGLDLPMVTLVGVIAADTGLFLPDFRAGERTFQLLTQVAGRAGRSALGGRVIIQTYRPDHYAIQAASHHDFEGFYRQEMNFRREQGYPPLRRLARLLYLSSRREKAEAEAARVAEALKVEIAADPIGLANTDLIGPAPCFFAQERNAYRWQVVVRSPDPAVLLRRVALDIGWRVDIDPTDLL